MKRIQKRLLICTVTKLNQSCQGRFTFSKAGSTFSQIEIRNGSQLTIDFNGYSLEGESIYELDSELIIK